MCTIEKIYIFQNHIVIFIFYIVIFIIVNLKDFVNNYF